MAAYRKMYTRALNTPALQARHFFTTLQPPVLTSTTAQVLSMGYVREQISVVAMTDTLVSNFKLFFFRDVKTLAYTGMLSMHHVAARITLRIRKKTYELFGTLGVGDIATKGFS